MAAVVGDAHYSRPSPHNLWASASFWLEQACASTRDADGNLVSPLPGLLARALDTYMTAAAEAERAAELQLTPALRGAAPVRCPPPSCLHGSRPPVISISSYASRLGRYCGCSPICFLAAYAYVLRLAAAAAAGACGGLAVTPLTAHRLLITGTVISIKMSEDRYYSNEFYAQGERGALSLFAGASRRRQHLSPASFPLLQLEESAWLR